MLVVSDIDDVFLPKPTDLLVNLAEARGGLESLLGRVNDMFQENSIIGSAMGPALQAGFKLMVGNMIVSSITPNTMFAGSHWRKDHRALCHLAQSWSRCLEES
jgi:protein transport protein SEC24